MGKRVLAVASTCVNEDTEELDEADEEREKTDPESEWAPPEEAES